MKTTKHSARSDALPQVGSDPNDRAKLPPEVKGKIGENLRLMYGAVIKQGVPERFAAILKRLDQTSDEKE
jgi:hypothetical protein